MTAKPMDEYSMMINGRKVQALSGITKKACYYIPLQVIKDRSGVSDEILAKSFENFTFEDRYYRKEDELPQADFDNNLPRIYCF